ncbi:MAG TPA: hypothetical protein VG826_02205 [Pirellulales bacterium]|nr:hypothetical protein [Pirellulales bacterium]
MTRISRLALPMLVTLFCASGATCPQFVNTYGVSQPRILPPAPTITDVITTINNNSAKIQSLATDDAKISVPFMPSVRAHLYLDRPRRFRLLGETSLFGPEADLGSNDDIFWFWVKRNPQPAVFYCRHDQFETSLARNMLPVEPEWIIEALGIVTFDPAGQYSPPVQSGQRRLRFETAVDTAHGRMTKVTEVDESQGWIVGQHLYDAQRQLVASALASNHGREPATGVALPSRIDIQTPATATSPQFSLRLELHNVRVNQLPSNQEQLWTLPSYPGATPINLADPNLRMIDPRSNAQPPAQPAGQRMRPPLR